MNIRISIKDSENPATVTKNTLSEVEHKKKSMLYSPPQKDKTNNKKPNIKKQPQKHSSLETTEN